MIVTVETRYGKIRAATDGGVAVFRGIPFARPPLGALRFMPPERPEPWPGIRDGRPWGPAAPQLPSPFSVLSRTEAPKQSEDCLQLNIWTPSLEGAPRPVLVWIHGGRFTEGSASLADTNGRRLARRGDVVVVSLQYRLGALGFLHLRELGPGSPGASNLGLLDQIAALEWIRDEIDAFGGDPSNVTLFGGSAGGSSVAALLSMPRARGLFQRAIVQSGVFTAHDTESATRVASGLLEELDLSARDVEKLRDLPLERLLQAQQRCGARLTEQLGDLPFQPVIDGEILPKTPLAAAQDAEMNPVPLIVGSNLDEMRILDAIDPSLRELDERGLRERLELQLRASPAGGPRAAQSALEVYSRARADRGLTQAAELWCAIESDRLFHSPTARVAELHSKRQPQTYAYLFRWGPRASGSQLGAFHGVEVPFVFGTLEDHSLRELVRKSHETTSLARSVQDAWLAFARTGDPSHAGLGGWPTYAPPRRATMILDEPPEVQEAPLEDTRRFWQEIAESD